MAQPDASAVSPSPPPDSAAVRPMSAEEKRVIFASSLGTVFEWYDFYLYGSLAAATGGRETARYHLDAARPQGCAQGRGAAGHGYAVAENVCLGEICPSSVESLVPGFVVQRLGMDDIARLVLVMDDEAWLRFLMADLGRLRGAEKVPFPGFSAQSFRYSRSRFVWARLTGISVPFASFIRRM